MRILFFMVFFSVGAVSLALAALGPELVSYYDNRSYVGEARNSINRLESLNAKYGTLLTRIEEDPNLVRRVAPVTLGTDVNEPDTVYPRARAKELEAARRALADEANQSSITGPPLWLKRCVEPQRRKGLFGAGSALILVSFVCFGQRKKEVVAPTRSRDRDQT